MALNVGAERFAKRWPWSPARTRSVTASAERSLENWGLLNMVFLMSTMFISKFYIDTNLHALGYLSCLTWVLIALLKGFAPVRVPLFMWIVVLFQVWLAFTTVYAEIAIVRKTVFNPTNYTIFLYFLAFLQGTMLSYRSARARQVFMKIWLGTLIASGAVAWLQVMGFGPAKALLSLSAEFTVKGTADTAVRASGLLQDIGWAAAFGCLGSIMIASFLVVRNLKWYEWAAIALLMTSSLLPQTRNQIPLIVITLIWIGVLVVRRYGARGVIGSALVTTTVGMVMSFNLERFAYITRGGTDTMTFRRENLWSQAWNAYREMPWTGIGQEAAFVSYQSQVFPNKWVSINLMDSGYMLALAWGGIVGLALLILAVTLGMVQAIRLAQLPTPDDWSRAGRYALVLVGLYYLIGMYFGNQWGTPYRAFPFALIGISLPTIRYLRRSSAPATDAVEPTAPATATQG